MELAKGNVGNNRRIRRHQRRIRKRDQGIAFSSTTERRRAIRFQRIRRVNTHAARLERLDNSLEAIGGVKTRSQTINVTTSNGVSSIGELANQTDRRNGQRRAVTEKSIVERLIEDTRRHANAESVRRLADRVVETPLTGHDSRSQPRKSGRNSRFGIDTVANRDDEPRTPVYQLLSRLELLRIEQKIRLMGTRTPFHSDIDAELAKGFERNRQTLGHQLRRGTKRGRRNGNRRNRNALRFRLRFPRITRTAVKRRHTRFGNIQLKIGNRARTPSNRRNVHRTIDSLQQHVLITGFQTRRRNEQR